MKLILMQHIRSDLSPFCQVAGEVLAKADDPPVLSVVDPIESLSMGQGHLSTKKEQMEFIYYPVDSQVGKCRKDVLLGI